MPLSKSRCRWYFATGYRTPAMAEGTSGGTSDEEVMDVIRDHRSPAVGTSDIADRVHVSRQAVDRRLRKLEEDGLVERYKPGRDVNGIALVRSVIRPWFQTDPRGIEACGCQWVTARDCPFQRCQQSCWWGDYGGV